MQPIRNVTKTSGAISYWREGEEEFTVTRNANGLPTAITALQGKWQSQKCEFTYDALGNFTSMVGGGNALLPPW